MDSATGTEDAQRLELLTTALQAYVDEFQQLNEIWKRLETKAQGTTAIGGIFLAAALAFHRDLTQSATGLQLAILALTVGMLGCSMLLAVASLLVKGVPGPPYSAVQIEAEQIAAVPSHELPERIHRFKRSQLDRWRSTNKNLREAANAKADCLISAQHLLLFAAIGVTSLAVLTLARVFQQVARGGGA